MTQVKALRDALSPTDGILIVNIVARSEVLFAQALATVSGNFSLVLQFDVEEDINRIVVGVRGQHAGERGGGGSARGQIVQGRTLAQAMTRLQVAGAKVWADAPNAKWTKDVSTAIRAALLGVQVLSSHSSSGSGSQGDGGGGGSGGKAGGRKKSTKKKKKKKKK